MRSGSQEYFALVVRPTPERRVKFGEGLKAHARPLGRGPGRHIAVDEQPRARQLLQVFQQQHEARAPSRDGVYAGNPDRDARRDAFAERSDHSSIII